MAKGGTNLNPGADATLVAAATKAAMANVPKDLSGTFQAMSLTYDSAMKSIGTAFGEAAKNIGKIGGQLALEAADKISLMNYGKTVDIDILDKEVENLDSNTEKKSESGDVYNPEQGETLLEDVDIKATKVKTETFADRIRTIRKDLSRLYAKSDPASQKRKRELRAERDSKFTVLRKMRDDDMFNDQLLASNNVNYNATGSLNLAMKQGINAWMKKKDGVIKEGLYEGYKASLVTDDDGDMSWVLRDKDDNLVTGRNGDELTIGGDKPYMVKFNEVNTMLTPNMDQKAVDDINKVIASEEIRGKKEGTSFMGNALLSKFKTSLNNETWLHQATDITFGDSESTLREKLHNPSAASAELFVGLGSAKLTAMKDDKGNPLFKDANDDGIIGDNPATEKIETGDFFGGDPETNKNNMAKLTNAILNKEDDNYDVENLKYFLEKEILSAGSAMFKVGETQRQSVLNPPNPNLPNASTIKSSEWISFGGKNQTGNVAAKVLNDMSTGEVIDPMSDDTYLWQGDGWYSGSQMVAKDNDALAKDVLQVRDQRFYGIPNPTSTTSGGGLEVVVDKEKAYGSKIFLGKQNTKAADILSSLQSFDPNLKTVGDLERLLGRVESSDKLKKELIDHLNEQMGTSIGKKHLDDMIKDLIGNTKKKLK
jgi:hypothetical protein